jgi:hypothetical protein
MQVVFVCAVNTKLASRFRLRPGDTGDVWGGGDIPPEIEFSRQDCYSVGRTAIQSVGLLFGLNIFAQRAR